MHTDVPTMVVKYLRTIEPESSLVHPLLKLWDKDYTSPPTARPKRKRRRSQRTYAAGTYVLGQCSGQKDLSKSYSTCA